MAQLLSNLPIGAKVKFGKHSINGETAQDIIWLVVAKNHSSTPNYPSNSVTLLTEKIIDLRALDATEPNNPDASRKSSGNNDYSVSNLDQWLNKDGSPWYVAQHTYDQSPDKAHTTGGAAYDTRPGFLNNFSLSERNAILDTTIRVGKYGGTSEDIIRKVYLPSAFELGIEVASHPSEGVRWAFFSNNTSRIAGLTTQCYNLSLTDYRPSGSTSAFSYLLRTPLISNPHIATIIDMTGATSFSGCMSDMGVRPALNLSANRSISNTTDSDGCYTMEWGSAPTQPATLNVPTIYGGRSNAISWSNATDADGDTITYTLECSVDGGAYSQLYSGAALGYAHFVSPGTSTVSYRVKASDPTGESSAYNTSATLNVVNNDAPVISGADANLGVKSSGFTGTYTITDVNNDAVTVTEAIDGVQIRSLVATLGEEITYGITENTWVALANGSHTLTIRATDGIDTTVRTYTFTKLVEALKIQNATPWVSSTMPSRIMLVVTRNIPSAAAFKVEVCNNGYDASPTWEDATNAVMSGLVHVFSNTTKTATNWGVLVRVTVARNGATGACYVSAIGGNFE